MGIGRRPTLQSCGGGGDAGDTNEKRTKKKKKKEKVELSSDEQQG
jgi:hypothetical protein